MVGGDGMGFDLNDDPTVTTKRARGTTSKGNAAKRNTNANTSRY